ncbi:hypothetical protein CJ255_09455 [Candidatus Viridilinea mediisalina]|uniref:DUF4194 domain-containing protein n=2 Tax=Candidatus Viridilinea mediisalina TaxID=2024553 RepID=A0A2A6RKD8_9CHLR|nr:hypothetical protein CJ255_09455 [Candidatus Viridilinea mediisalina]
MSLHQFALDYSQLPSSEQSQFAQATRRLLADGIIWREEEQDRPIYSFLVRRRELVADYLAVAGWELRHEERIGAFHVVHREGAHRRRFNREQTIWLLLLRLLYAEKRERLEVSLTRYPVVEVAEVARRYAEFFPGQQVRKRSSLTDALRSFQTLKLVRAAGGGTIRAGQSEQLIELLPTLEMIVPAQSINALGERLGQYDRTRSENEGDASDEA